MIIPVTGRYRAHSTHVAGALKPVTYARQFDARTVTSHARPTHKPMAPLAHLEIPSRRRVRIGHYIRRRSHLQTTAPASTTSIEGSSAVSIVVSVLPVASFPVGHFMASSASGVKGALSGIRTRMMLTSLTTVATALRGSGIVYRVGGRWRWALEVKLRFCLGMPSAIHSPKTLSCYICNSTDAHHYLEERNGRTETRKQWGNIIHHLLQT